MILRKSTILLITFLSMQILCAQKNMSGTILNQETMEPVTHAHIIIPSEKRETTGNSKEHLEFTVLNQSIGKTLSINCVGFEDKNVQVIRAKGMMLHMKPSVEFLSTVQLSNTKKEKQQKSIPFEENEGESFSYYLLGNGWKKVGKLKMPENSFSKNQIVALALKEQLTN